MAKRLEPGEETCVHVEVAGRLYEVWIGAPALGEPHLDITLREETPTAPAESELRAALRVKL